MPDTPQVPSQVPTAAALAGFGARRRRPTLAGLVLMRESWPAGFAPAASRAPLRSPRDAYAIVAPCAERAEVENFWILPMDAQHRMVTSEPILVTRGILNSSLVHPREVFRAAIVAGAAAMVLAHNHPSGDPTPSLDDRVVTEQLVAAGRLLDIPVHDHIVVGAGRYVSFAEAGLL